MKKPRHATLKRRAEIIDLVIEHYNKARKRKNFPRKIVEDLVRLVFPISNFEGRGAFKEVHKIRSRAFKRVLKVSNDESTRRDWKAYQRLPKNIRNRYFAKIYWSTKYCQLQKFGKDVKVPKDELRKLKAIGNRYGLTDIRPANVRKIDGHFKIVDASVRRK